MQRPSYSSYTALGDSYAAGLASENRLKLCNSSDSAASPFCTFTDPSSFLGLGGCNKDNGSYAYLFAERHVDQGINGNFLYATCSGANTTNVIQDQLQFVKSPELLTVQMGGDDFTTFFDVILACVTNSSCTEAIQNATSKLPAILTNVNNALGAIDGRLTSSTTKALVGYVQFFGYATTCEFPTSLADRQRLNNLVGLANKGLQSLASLRNYLFINADPAFATHRWCDTSTPWWFIDSLTVSGLDTSGGFYIEGSLAHPTELGQQAYLAALEGALGL